MRPLNEIKRDADNASEGPWTFARWNVGRSFDNMYGLLGDGELQHCLPIYVKFTAIEDDDDGNPIDRQGEKDATFVVNARQDIPDLLAEVARLTAEVQRLETSWRGADTRACSAQDEVARLTAVVKDLQDDNAFQAKRVAELEAALGPLANLSIEAFAPTASDGCLLKGYVFRLGDVRRAKRALGEGGK